VRGGVITGRVTDAEGRPLIARGVSLQVVDEQGGKSPVPIPNIMELMTNSDALQTDDRGVYRLFGLRAGRYLVSAGGDSEIALMTGAAGKYPRTWHPDATDENQAKVIEVKAGDEITGVDIKLGVANRTFEAAGRVVDDETGKPIVGANVMCIKAKGADLPDENWYIRAITQSASPKPIDVSRAGVALKQGEKLSGFEMIIALGAASLSGKVVPLREGAQLPKRLRVHLIPAETAAADYLLRYAEAPVRGDGSFDLTHIAPGKYLLRTRQAAEKEANDAPVRPLAWDAVERAKLRREAAAAKNEIELKVCDRVKDHVLRW
jgi:hypothetical protein